MSLHTCDALVVSCIDFRFQKYIRDWLDRSMARETFDYVGYAGATKDLPTIMNQLEISVRLHKISRVVLIHHEDCGAYGAQSSRKRHAADLRKAKETILKSYPDLRVSLYYLHLDGEFEKV